MQPDMFEGARVSSAKDKPVNVSSVTHRSPFRYPGGKTWLVPQIRNWLGSIFRKPHRFIEPFVGGGIVSLTVAAERLAERVIMVELDDQVAAVWKTIFEDNKGEWLANQVMSFDVSKFAADDLRTFVEAECSSTEDRAFKTIVKNRTYHGGILAPGSAPIKNGENGKGTYSRWYPETLRKRILGISQLRERVEFIHGDGLAIMEQNLASAATVFFIDPPYTASGKSAGNRLYSQFTLDHEKLFSLASRASGDFLMTYDNAPEIHALAERYGFQTRLIAMKNTHNAEMNELLIGRDLSWVD